VIENKTYVIYIFIFVWSVDWLLV